jgi:hypothetical protein
MLVSCLVYSSTLKMEAICFSETLGDIQQTIQHYIPEDGTLHLWCYIRSMIESFHYHTYTVLLKMLTL